MATCWHFAIFLAANCAVGVTEGSSPKQQDEPFTDVIDGLQKTYQDCLKPLEDMYAFNDFYGPIILDAKPMVLLLGQYSSGKTTFMHYLLNTRKIRGTEIGPHPTTDVFMAVKHGRGEQAGGVLVRNKRSPFGGLRQFGTNFTRRFKASSLPNSVLEKLTLIDTPGIQAGRRQREDRGYNFSYVSNWFAEQADMIVLFFDVHNIDISDELGEVIRLIKKHHNKLVVVLNKADTVTTHDLIYAYGGLMWNLGKIINTLEVVRTYIVSLWNEPLKQSDNADLLEKHKCEFLDKFQSLSLDELGKKVEKFANRANKAIVHAYVTGHLKSEMPILFERRERQEELLSDLASEFKKVAVKYDIAEDDLPDVHWMEHQIRTKEYDLGTKFAHPLQAQQKIDLVETMLSEELQDIAWMAQEEMNDVDRSIKGGAFDQCPT